MPSRWNNVLSRGARAIDEFCNHRGISSPVDRISFEMGQVYWYCDSSLAKRELGFAPAVAPVRRLLVIEGGSGFSFVRIVRS